MLLQVISLSFVFVGISDVISIFLREPLMGSVADPKDFCSDPVGSGSATLLVGNTYFFFWGGGDLLRSLGNYGIIPAVWYSATSQSLA